MTFKSSFFIPVTLSAGLLTWTIRSHAQEVGVGTTTPTARLHISAPQGYTNPILLIEQQGSAPPYVIVLPSGEVGIRIASPQAQLHVGGTTRIDDTLFAENGIWFKNELAPNGDPGQPGYVLMSQGPGQPPIWLDTALLLQDAWRLTGNAISANHFLGTTNNMPLIIRTNNVEQMRILPTGQVGIGVTNPQARLSVSGPGTGSEEVYIEGSNNQFTALRVSKTGTGTSGWNIGITTTVTNFSNWVATGLRADVYNPTPSSDGRTYGVYTEVGNENLNLGVFARLRGTEEGAAIYGWVDALPDPLPTLATSGRQWAGYFQGDVHVYRQLAVGTTNPDPSALAHFQTTTQGILLPRLTTAQRNNIANPANGLLILNTDNFCLEAYHSATNQWVQLGCLKRCPNGLPAIKKIEMWGTSCGVWTLLDQGSNGAILTHNPAFLERPMLFIVKLWSSNAHTFIWTPPQAWTPGSFDPNDSFMTGLTNDSLWIQVIPYQNPGDQHILKVTACNECGCVTDSVIIHRLPNSPIACRIGNTPNTGGGRSNNVTPRNPTSTTPPSITLPATTSTNPPISPTTTNPSNSGIQPPAQNPNLNLPATGNNPSGQQQ